MLTSCNSDHEPGTTLHRQAPDVLRRVSISGSCRAIDSLPANIFRLRDYMPHTRAVQLLSICRASDRPAHTGCS